ncbi:hypothetical protein SUGI_0788940 [Cryptomeria japonica]|nr:hypothetical protein SUGI_0788940 [Cryptomeria japonica]
MSTPRDRGMAQFLLIITAFCVTIQSCNSDGCSINYPQTCGYLNINYPFNIQGSNCGHSNFSLLCKRNSTFGQGSIPFLSTPTGEFQVLNLSYNSLLINISHLKAISCNVSQSAHEFFSLPRDGPFTISGSNVFASVGCYTNGSFFPTALQSRVGGMCGASCLKIYQPEYCNGFGCCQIGLIENWRSVNFSVQPPSGECVFSTILDPTTFKIQVPDKGRFGAGTYGLKIDWGFKAENCSSANQMGNLTCSRHAHCLDVTGMPGYKVCRCDEGYEGDGYQEGVQCTDINECDIFQNECILPPVGRCVNMNGSYACFCAKGKGDGKTSCTDDSILAPLLIGISTSLVGGPLIGGAMFWVVKKRKQLLLRRKYFLQNKGLLLQEYISSDRGRRKATIFSESELVKATNNFSEDLKVGVGGFGNVYQGKLAEGRAKEERILADLFLCRKGQGLVAELFDTRLVEKDQMKSMKSVANLAEACLNEDVNMRPSMKEILQELLLIRSGNMTGIRGVVHSWITSSGLKKC